MSARETPKNNPEQPSQGGQGRWVIWVCGCGCTFLEEDGKSKVCSLHFMDPDYEVTKVEVCPVSERDEWKAESDRQARMNMERGVELIAPLLKDFDGDVSEFAAFAASVAEKAHLEADRLALELADLKGDG